MIQAAIGGGKNVTTLVEEMACPLEEWGFIGNQGAFSLAKDKLVCTFSRFQLVSQNAKIVWNNGSLGTSDAVDGCLEYHY